MSLALNKIKSRIKSVSGAYKVTNAMKLVSTIKLQKWKKIMSDVILYTDKLRHISEKIFIYADKNSSLLLRNNNSKNNKKLYIVITSSLGLCGSYNVNMYNFMEEKVDYINDEIIIIGSKGRSHFSSSKYNINRDFDDFISLDDEKNMRKILRYAIEKYKNLYFKEIHILYTHFKNSITFILEDFQLLPLNKEEKIKNDFNYPPFLEPSKEELIESLIPIVLQNEFYYKILDSQISEQASRCNAMENATKNAEDLLANLKIEFNKARQAAITQEIVEIVAASKK